MRCFRGCDRDHLVKVGLGVFFFLVSSNLLADYNFTGCHIEEIVEVNNTNNSHVRLDCEITPRPTCAVAGAWFAIDKSTDQGKQLLSLVTTAFSINAIVSGNVNQNQGSCPTWQNNIAMLVHLRVKRK
jgi:hypothetical protein